MFSRRLPWPVEPNRIARLLREKRRRGEAILDLTESNPTRVGLDYPAEEIAAALADGGAAAYDPHPRGMPEAREAVAAHYARRGLAVPADRIVLTASTSEAYALLFKMLSDPGDRVLVPRPSYPLFDYLAALESLAVSPYPIVHEGGWSIDLQGLKRQLEAREAPPATAVVVVNPNNPTGTGLREGERIALEQICGRRGTAIISDEVFFDYLALGPAVPDAERGADRIVSLLSPLPALPVPAPLRFTLGGLSKACGLPQMKLAWIVVDGPGEPADEAIDRLELIADTYLSVGTPVQRAAARLLDLGERIQQAIRSRVAGNRLAIPGMIGRDSPCRLLEADGGWSAVLQVPALQPEEDLVLALLAQDDTLVHPGYFFDFPREAYLVPSLLPAPGEFREALRRLLARASG